MNHRKYDTLLGLPHSALNALSTGVAIAIICIGYRVATASNLTLQVANNRLITSSSADKLEALAAQLDKQAELIKQKDIAYRRLEDTYNGYLTNEKGAIDLDEAFDVIEKLPEVENTAKIQQEISEVEEDLSEITIE